MIEVRIINQDRVIETLGRVPEKARSALVRTFARIGFALQSYTIETLEGRFAAAGSRSPRPGHKSGHLKASIHSEPVEVSGGDISVAVGTNVEYAPPHEHGFDGEVYVRAHTAHNRNKTWPVKAHPMQMHVKAKHFMRDALKEYAPRARTQVEATVQRVLGGRS